MRGTYSRALVSSTTKLYSKPAFANKPLASPAWSSSKSWDTMKHPSLMSSEELGSACVAAAREQVESPTFWKLVAERVSTIESDLEPRDIALILNGFSRTRQLRNHAQLVSEMAQTIQKRLPYFSSLHLAMTLSAIGKSGLSSSRIPESLISALLKELKSRVHELGTSVEYSMVLNALVKLNVSDQDLYSRLGSIFQSKLRMGSISCHVRELCVIASSLANSGFSDKVFYETVAQRVIPTLSEATPAEVARLLSAMARAKIDVTELAESAKHSCGSKFKSMTSAEITNTVYALGQLCEVSTDNRAVNDLISLTTSTFIYSIPLFQLKEIAAVLTSMARWQITPSDTDLITITQKIQLMSRRFSDQNAGGSLTLIIPALATLCENSSGEAKLAISNFTRSTYNIVLNILPTMDWPSAVRVIAAFNQLHINDENLVSVVSSMFLKRRSELDPATRAALAEALVHSLSADHDLVLAIQDS